MKKIYTVSLDSELMDGFEKLAKSEHRSRSNMIEVLISNAVKESNKKKSDE